MALYYTCEHNVTLVEYKRRSNEDEIIVLLSKGIQELVCDWWGILAGLWVFDQLRVCGA